MKLLLCVSPWETHGTSKSGSEGEEMAGWAPTIAPPAPHKAFVCACRLRGADVVPRAATPQLVDARVVLGAPVLGRLDLQPPHGPPGPIEAVLPLRDDAFETHTRGVLEHDGAHCAFHVPFGIGQVGFVTESRAAILLAGGRGPH